MVIGLFLITIVFIIYLEYRVGRAIKVLKAKEAKETDEAYCKRMDECEQEAVRLAKVYADWKKNKGKPWPGC